MTQEDASLTFERERDTRERIRKTEDTARRSISTVAGLLLGFSLLAPRIPEAESRGFLIVSWVSLGTAVFVSTLHDLLMTDWVRDGVNHRRAKLGLNITGFVLLAVGLTSLLIFAGLNTLT